MRPIWDLDPSRWCFFAFTDLKLNLNFGSNTLLGSNNIDSMGFGFLHNFSKDNMGLDVSFEISYLLIELYCEVMLDYCQYVDVFLKVEDIRTENDEYPLANSLLKRL